MDATAALHEESLFQPAGDSHQASAEREYANYSYVRETIIRFFQNKSAAISLFLIILIVIISSIARILFIAVFSCILYGSIIKYINRCHKPGGGIFYIRNLSIVAGDPPCLEPLRVVLFTS